MTVLMSTTNLVLVSCLSAALVLLAVLLVLLLVQQRKKRAIEESERAAKQKIASSTSALSEEFGGNDNIVSITRAASRVTVVLRDSEKAEKEKIEQDWESVLFMGNKVVFVIGSKAAEFEELLSEKVASESEREEK